MPKDVFCEMCEKFFPMTCTAFCPLCGMTLRRGDGTLVTSPNKPSQPSSEAAQDGKP